MNRKEKNRIKSMAKNSSLSFFDKDPDKCEITLENMILDNMERCTPTIQKILEILLSSGPYRKKLLIDKLSSDSLVTICKLSQECSNDFENLNNIVIRTVIGAVEHMPFRALAYLLPAVNMAEAFIEYEKGINAKQICLPQIEFVFMLNIGVTLNGLNYDACLKEMSLFIEVANAYLYTYHPVVHPFVRFLIDESFTFDIRRNKNYRAYEEKVKNILCANPEVGTSIGNMGKRRGRSENSFEYAAMHPLLHDGLVDSSVASLTEYKGRKYHSNDSTMAIISVGARPEEEFWKVRKLVSENLKKLTFVSPLPVIQYITCMKVPPYSPLPTGELYLNEVIDKPELILQAKFKKYNEWSNYQIPVQKSIELLIRDTNDEDDLIELMKEITV